MTTKNTHIKIHPFLSESNRIDSKGVKNISIYDGLFTVHKIQYVRVGVYTNTQWCRGVFIIITGLNYFSLRQESNNKTDEKQTQRIKRAPICIVIVNAAANELIYMHS